jgi:rare lipoprotein A
MLLPTASKFMRWTAVALTALLVSACATAQTVAPQLVKRGWDGKIKIGKPYQINGVWYYPEDDATYDQVGLASWYGPDFHLKPTSNGETFDMNEVSAAHKTLPLPSFVEVTNLMNGRVLTIRVNDRGPFVGDRIIDLSRRAAELLDIHTKGVEKVRVRRVYPAGRPEVALLPPPAERRTQDLPPSEVPPAAPSGKVETAALPPPPRPTRVLENSGQAVAGTASTTVRQTASGTPALQPQPPAQLGVIYVQVAAVSDAMRAQELTGIVGRYGSTTIETVTSDSGVLYRVRIGPFETNDEAAPVLLEVQQAGFPQARTMTVQPPVS